MPITDNDPERRNITIMSLCIIVFYWAGGAFIDNNVRFAIVNIQFSNSERLEIFFWILFIYFSFRYWVTHKGLVKHSILSCLTDVADKSRICELIGKSTGLKVDTEGGFTNYGIWYGEYTWYLHYQVIKSIEEVKDGKIVKFTPIGGAEYIYLKHYSYLPFKVRILVKLLLLKKEVSAYIVPYLLIVLACVFTIVGKYAV